MLLETQYLGLCDYIPTLDEMREWTLARTENTPDKLWLLEHPSVFTLGQAADLQHILAPHICPKQFDLRLGAKRRASGVDTLVNEHGEFREGNNAASQTVKGIPVVKTDRGGQVTYHGPGQLVVYFLLDLKRRNAGVHDLVGKIQQAVQNLLVSYKIESHLLPKAPGVYVAGKKIASIGLRVRRGCSYHGLSLNVDMDLTPFSYINPCGFQNLTMTQLKDLQGPTDLQQVGASFIREFQEVL